MSATLQVTIFPAPARWASQGQHKNLRWKALRKQLNKPELWPGGRTVADADGRLPGWTFAKLRDDTRILSADRDEAHRATVQRVVSVHGLMIEYLDEPLVDASHLSKWWRGFAFAAHTTSWHDLPMEQRRKGLAGGS